MIGVTSPSKYENATPNREPMSTFTPTPATEINLLPEPTPLAVSLAAPLASYHGVLTPQQFDAEEAETRALLQSAAVHDLGWLRRIAVRGEDRFRWLSGMVTNAVESLPLQSGAYNLVLNAQGRIQGDVYIWREGDGIELEIAADQSEALLAHFDRFIVMDDVELVPRSDQSAIGLTGPQADRILESLGLDALSEPLTCVHAVIDGIAIRLFHTYGAAVPHYAIWAKSDQIPQLWQVILAAGATPVGSEALEALRIVEGIATFGIDVQSRDLPQETSLLRALSFTKGCYLGQEIVERIRSRGQVHRHLRHLELTLDDPSTPLPARSTELRKPDSVATVKALGELSSVTSVKLGESRRVFALAMIRAEAEVGSKTLTFPGGSAQILNTAPNFE